MRRQEAEFLGMELADNTYQEGEDPKDKEKVQRNHLKGIQKIGQEDYVTGLDEIKHLVKVNEGPDIK